MAVSTIPVTRRITVTDGSGIGGSAYITSFDARIVSVIGNTCCVLVACTTAAIPAWTQFLTIASEYRNSDLTHMRIAANKSQSSSFVEITVNPSTGYIATLSDAIPSGTLISFYVTYPLP